eukprot:6268061-Ditylum_brightwellii.AAC.1
MGPNVTRIIRKATDIRGPSLEQGTNVSVIQDRVCDKVRKLLTDSSVEFKCTVFEDSNGSIELSKCARMRLKTKHISIKYHHCRKKVEEGLIK